MSAQTRIPLLVVKEKREGSSYERAEKASLRPCSVVFTSYNITPRVIVLLFSFLNPQQHPMTLMSCSSLTLCLLDGKCSWFQSLTITNDAAWNLAPYRITYNGTAGSGKSGDS